MSVSLVLPRADGTLAPYVLSGVAVPAERREPPRGRVVFAAAHVVADPLRDGAGQGPAVLDWDATLAFRRHLWSLGFGVAEAMDTAQRGGGLDWPAARELIRRAGAEAAAVGGRIAAGAGTDQLPADKPATLEDVAAAYREQCAVVEDAGAQVVLMASRALAAAARGPEDYAAVYGPLLEQAAAPVILHWLGEPFDPALAGYWGAAEPADAAEHLLALVAAHADKVDGVKVSVLDADLEVAFRRRLPPGVRCYTGDDFHYPELIHGDAEGHSDALLGVFDPIAPAAAAALAALDAGDAQRYGELLAPTPPLARRLFEAPTRFYKTGVVLLAHLADHQRHFRMVGGAESARPLAHLADLFVLADRAGLFADPELAAARMRRILAVAGVDA